MAGFENGNAKIFDGLPGPVEGWEGWFEEGTPQERLSRLFDGDPLGMIPRVQVWISAHGYFINPEALYRRGLSRVVVEFDARDLPKDFNTWCAAALETASRELIDEEAEEERQFLPNAESENGAFYHAVAELLSIEHEMGRLVCTTLNHLGRRQRQAVATVGFAKLPIEQFAEIEGCTMDEAVEAFESAMTQVLLAVADREGTDLGPFGQSAPGAPGGPCDN